VKQQAPVFSPTIKILAGDEVTWTKMAHSDNPNKQPAGKTNPFSQSSSAALK
jgi:hypothetical protein